jgi:Zn-dependent protease with chaperone function
VDGVKPPLTIKEVLKNELVNHFRTHPPTQERLQRLERLPLDDAAPKKKKEE